MKHVLNRCLGPQFGKLLNYVGSALQLTKFESKLMILTCSRREEYNMAMLAMCMPILAGKKEKWQAMMDQVTNDPNFAASRENAGVHERSFLQETPAGDFVILTFEGDDPEASFAQIMQNMPADFAEFAKDVHGLDVNAPPPPMPKLVFNSRS